LPSSEEPKFQQISLCGEAHRDIQAIYSRLLTAGHTAKLFYYDQAGSSMGVSTHVNEWVD
jgi:hypothetical protein